MKNAKEKCNFAIGMAAIWSITFATMLVCFVKWGSIFSAICMAFSYFKTLSYMYDVGFYEAGAKTLDVAVAMTNAVMNRKDKVSENVQIKSASDDQTESINKDDYN